jgi:hypothetical protein
MYYVERRKQIMPGFLEDLKKDIRKGLRSLMWFSLIGTPVVFLAGIVLTGLNKTEFIIEWLIISLVVPPIVWFIGKITI